MVEVFNIFFSMCVNDSFELLPDIHPISRKSVLGKFSSQILGDFQQFRQNLARLIKICNVGGTSAKSTKDYLVQRSATSIPLVILGGNSGTVVKLIFLLIFGVFSFAMGFGNSPTNCNRTQR